jgi:hypothetical protein
VRRAPIVLLLLAVLLAGCGGGGDPEGLSDLTTVEELRAEFNDRRGEPRVILVLSPT